MTKKEEIQTEINKIWLILVNAKECFHYSYYLHKPSTLEEQNYVDESVDFIFIRGILWKMAVTELSKLFSSKNSDRSSIIRFIEKFEKDGYFGSQKIDNKTVEEWKSDIENNKETINEIVTLRDKAYSHTDPNYNEYNLEITFEETEKLIDIAEKVITDIFYKVLNSGAHFDNGRFEKENFDILKILAEDKKKYIENLINEAKR
ncbi:MULTISPECIES: hypothetical protein [unclassified Flavobacterium]|uniref:AbiU2 domain-containing protein n=1 Tax=unclassified Flavobacterium TaxID=196869 RepID=UPI0006ABD157|nr:MULTISPECIES: hypothetical protein [unclassified Flavobacterium]KOP38878.1 hypothetical protein AKO67_07605 [Flavobacterium sp. VMW]OWU92829.1 hypothetical protein APR43_01870 [Flavobacterium sp. NLM]